MTNMQSKAHLIRMAVAAGVASLLLACSDDSPDKLLASAKDYVEKGDNAAAIIQLKNALQRSPENGEIRLLLGRAYVETRDFASAEKELRRALELNEAADKVLPLLGRALTELGQTDKLIKEFGESKLADPLSQATVQTLIGDALIRRNDRVGAAAAYANALAARSDYAPALLGRAALAGLEGRLDEATQQVESIVAAAPKLAEAHAFQADLLMARGDRAGARKALEQAVAADASYLPARLSLISMLTDDREFDQAAKLLDGTRKLAPRDVRLTYLDAALAYRKGEFEKARSHIQQVMKLLPDHIPSLVLAAAIDLQGNQLTAAEASLRKVVSRAPNHSSARQLLVQTYLRMGQPARAKEALQPLIDRGLGNDARLQLLAGETYLANGDVQRATTHYQAASQDKSVREVAARTRLGQIALATGKSEEGFKELETASELNPGMYQADLALIASHLRRKEYDKAMEGVKALEKKQPKNPLTFQMYGVVNLAKGDVAAARAGFERALELKPGYVPAAYNLGILDLNDKKPENARKRYEAMIAKEPNNEQLYVAMAELQARSGAEPKEVAAILQRGVTANPQSPGVRLALINLHLRTGEKKAALNAAQEALAALPSEPRVVDIAGVAQENAGEINQAIETYSKLVTLQPHAPQPLYRLAGLYVRQKDTDKAIEALHRAQKLVPNARDVVPRLVQVYLMANRTDDAFKEVRALQKREPESAIASVLEGDVYAAQRKFGDAERAYRQALKLEPAANAVAIKLHSVMTSGGKAADADAWGKKWMADNPKDVTMRLYLGERDLMARNLKAAAAHYQAALAIDPNSLMALNNLAWIGGESGDAKALGYAERAFRLAPDNIAVLDTYGMLLVKRGDAAKGLPHVARASRLAPGRHDIRLNHARALTQAGQKDAARKELEALQAVPEDFPGKGEIAAMLKAL